LNQKKMKKQTIKMSVLALGTAFMFGMTSCSKPECHECHYDGPNGEVELGEKCDEELESLEANGYTEGGTTYTVHCHEH